MEELLRTNDPVLLSFAEALLKDAGIQSHIFDQNMSVLEGSIGVLTRRLLVHGDDLNAARNVLDEAGMGSELVRKREE
ncbi:MAG: putative signal transducing protein [Alphaproteobacteria bacterium]